MGEWFLGEIHPHSYVLQCYKCFPGFLNEWLATILLKIPKEKTIPKGLARRVDYKGSNKPGPTPGHL